MAINEAALAAAQETERQLGLIQYPSEDLTVAKASAAETTLAVSMIRDPVKNAHFYGAKGDGRTNDTAALNKMAATGEMLFDTAGTFLIDYTGVQIITRTRMRVTVPGVVFKMIPNSQSRYYLFRIRSTASDCDLDFGPSQIVGDREQHVYAGSSTHEHGYGIFVSGERNQVYSSAGYPGDLVADPKFRGALPGGCRITGCTGDGMGTAGPGHRVFGFVFDYCRRQGISVFEGRDAEIHHNTIRDIGNRGAEDPAGLIGPFACIDAEPDEGHGDVAGLHIHHNRLETSRTGLTVWVRSEVTSKISGQFTDNDVIGHSNGAWLKDAKSGRPATINFEMLRNTWINNKNHDIRADQGSIVKVGDGSKTNANTFDDLRDRADVWRAGAVSPEIGRYSGAQVSAPLNAYI